MATRDSAAAGTEFVDVVPCGWCGRPIQRNVRQFKGGVRYHYGVCSVSSRGLTWPEERLTAHMQMMQRAAAKGRRAAFLKRLQQLAPGVSLETAERLWKRGYSAGFTARQRKRGGRA